MLMRRFFLARQCGVPLVFSSSYEKILHPLQMNSFRMSMLIQVKIGDMKLLTFVTVLSSATCCSAYNILVFSPYPTWSQYIQMEPLFSALGLRGHNVTVVSPFPPKKEQSHFHHIPFVADLYWKNKCKLH